MLPTVCKAIARGGDDVEDERLLYAKYYSDVYKFVLKLTCFDKSLAEDLTQETFLQAFISFKRFEGRASVKTWLIAIAKNVAFAYFRKHKDRPLLTEEDIGRHSDPHVFVATVEQREQVRCVLSVIKALPPKTADVMILRLIAELPFEQIGDQLQMSPGSARVLFMRGKNELLKQMKERYRYEI